MVYEGVQRKASEAARLELYLKAKEKPNKKLIELKGK